ncbi:MAG: hypothetical protein CM15mV117_130 [Caudoviricetes sp.]|nr:MAG: hypothetical protein CM15mV117_130 [Caudoviricetes sp.]
MAAPFQNYFGGVLFADIVKRNNFVLSFPSKPKKRGPFIKSGAVVRIPFFDSKERGEKEYKFQKFNPFSN